MDYFPRYAFFFMHGPSLVGSGPGAVSVVSRYVPPPLLVTRTSSEGQSQGGIEECQFGVILGCVDHKLSQFGPFFFGHSGFWQ